DFEHSQIDLRIRTDQASFFRLAIAQLHFDLINLIDNVIVRNDVPLVCDNYAGTERILHQSLVIWIPKSSLIAVKKFEEIESAFPRYRNLLGCFHRDDGRDYATDECAPLPVQCLQRGDLL